MGFASAPGLASMTALSAAVRRPRSCCARDGLVVSRAIASDVFVGPPAALRRILPPRGENHQPENRVHEREHPERSFEENDALQPLLDEALLITRRAGSHSQPRLQRRERAQLTEPSLRRDDPDGEQMRE